MEEEDGARAFAGKKKMVRECLRGTSCELRNEHQKASQSLR